MNFFSQCLLGHSDEWTRVIVDGVWRRACSRCLTPLTAILGHRGNSEDIQPAKVPPILARHAQVVPKPKRARKVKRPVTPFEKRA